MSLRVRPELSASLAESAPRSHACRRVGRRGVKPTKCSASGRAATPSDSVSTTVWQAAAADCAAPSTPLHAAPLLRTPLARRRPGRGRKLFFVAAGICVPPRRRVSSCGGLFSPRDIRSPSLSAGRQSGAAATAVRSPSLSTSLPAAAAARPAVGRPAQCCLAVWIRAPLPRVLLCWARFLTRVVP